jgi:hypothetical protein
MPVPSRKKRIGGKRQPLAFGRRVLMLFSNHGHGWPLAWLEMNQAFPNIGRKAWNGSS